MLEEFDFRQVCELAKNCRQAVAKAPWLHGCARWDGGWLRALGLRRGFDGCFTSRSMCADVCRVEAPGAPSTTKAVPICRSTGSAHASPGSTCKPLSGFSRTWPEYDDRGMQSNGYAAVLVLILIDLIVAMAVVMVTKRRSSDTVIHM